jgi:hypothetical protein
MRTRRPFSRLCTALFSSGYIQEVWGIEEPLPTLIF